MKDKLSLAANSFRAGIASNNINSMVFWGLVTRVDSELNVMDVDIYSGNVETTAKNVQINTMLTSYGAGLRIIPKSGVTLVLLIRETAEEWYHIGFYLDGVDTYLSDKKSDYEFANNMYIPLRRFLEEGETQLTSMSGNEIFLSNEGSILIKSQYGAYLNIDNMVHKLDGFFANLKYEMDGVRIRSGNVFRPVDKVTREEILIYSTTSSGVAVVKAEDMLTSTEETNATLIKEFTVQIGTKQDPTTGIDDPIISPSIATLSFGDKIIDEWGSEVKVDATSLKAILKFSEFLTNNGDSLSGLSLSFDHEGSLVLADTTNGNYIKFKTSTNLLDETKHETDLTVFINKTTFNINKDGELYYHIENPDDSSKTTTINVLKDGTTTILSSDAIHISSGDTTLEPSVLGDTLDSLLKSILSHIISHTHGTGVGPSTVPVNVADFQTDNSNVDSILSPKVKNN